MSNKVVVAGALILASLLPANVGFAEDAAPFHRGAWPIHNGRNYQPTENELRALQRQDVTPDEAREIDRLYDQLLSGTEAGRRRHSASSH